MQHKQENMVAVIMAGGFGTRFWPLSTKARPKQFIQLLGDRSLLQKSYERVSDLLPPERILVLTNAVFADLVAAQLPDLPSGNVLGEPERKDTAAAVCLGSLIGRQRFGNPVLLVLTADQLIEPVDKFQQTLLSAAVQARARQHLYTCGVRPTYPATGYGYLELGDKELTDGSVEHFPVRSFREKPDLTTARGYLESGRHLWNSGVFVWTAEAILREIRRHLPGHLEHLEPAMPALDTPHWPRALAEAFSALERISIDFAVMEKAENVHCVTGDFTWQDLGGWLAMRDFLPADSEGNHARGQVHTLAARDNLVFCQESQETVALLGVENLVVVRAGDRTLVAHRDRLEDIKTLVETAT